MEEIANGFSFPHQHAFYIQSMLFNTTSALKSCHIAITLLEKNQSGEIDIQDSKDRFLDSLHNIINQSGAISRYFWPASNQPKQATEAQKNLHKNRGGILRKVFDIKEDSHLQNRGLRNAIEHFDERLDLYLEQGIFGYIFPSLILDEPDNSGVTHHIFRAYYLKDGIFQILGERFVIQPIVDELVEIHKKLILFDKEGGVFPTL